MYLLKTSYAKTLQLQTAGFDVEVEIAALSAKNKSLIEAPIDFYPRVGTQKLNPWKDGLKILKTITKLSIQYKSLRFISFFATLLLFPGLLSYIFFPNLHIGSVLIALSLQGISLLYIDSKFLKKP
jgi:dolichol-phosphate mannosyltransferase